MEKEAKKLKFHIHTFGCQMNKNDSERIAGILKACGANASNSLEQSDLVIVNTCAVRKKSEEKLYSYLGRLASLKEKKKIIIGVVGCVAQLYKSELLEKRPFIDFVLGPDNYSQLREVILSSNEEKFIATRGSLEFQEIPHHLLSRESAVSSYVTIMEGCNNFCSYCIVPFVRGREKFRPMKNILGEVQYLADRGYKEIQLLGQNVNSYQDPETGKDFSEVLSEVNRVEGIEWIRFITSHPKNFNEKIARAMKEAKKVCRQLHLPIQSGSSTVLKRMNRGYTKEDYLEKISILRNLMPDISLSTDIIVGFPGETEEEFQETMSILREVHYTNIFSSRYSPRPLTAASEEKDTISFEEKKRRLTLVQQLQKELQLELHKSLVGRVMKVLCLGKSKKDSDLFSGRNEGYRVVNFKSKNDVIGHFVDIRITSFGPYSLIGEKIP
jgi:tRNA-2-methylthio-N6-dimethylallyladenosine synthase